MRFRIEQATREQLVQAVIGLRQSNVYLRHRLEALHVDIRRLLANSEPLAVALRDQPAPSASLQ